MRIKQLSNLPGQYLVISGNTHALLESVQHSLRSSAIAVNLVAQHPEPFLVWQGAPPGHGQAFIGDEEKDISQARKFSDLPLSENTKEGLKEAKFTHLTAIQRFALPQALCGRDVFGAAKTGSGKTLAFILPVGLTAMLFLVQALSTMLKLLPISLAKSC